MGYLIGYNFRQTMATCLYVSVRIRRPQQRLRSGLDSICCRRYDYDTIPSLKAYLYVSAVSMWRRIHRSRRTRLSWPPVLPFLTFLRGCSMLALKKRTIFRHKWLCRRHCSCHLWRSGKREPYITCTSLNDFRSRFQRTFVNHPTTKPKHVFI